MNKRANLYLNIYEFIAFILALTCIGLCMTIGELSFPVPTIMRITILGIGTLSALLFISIEVFLFLLMNTKARLIYLAYMLLDIVLAVFMNKLLPFSAFLVVILLCITKNILKVKLVDKIYIPREFNRYCRMFNIKVKDFPKKRKKKEVVEETVEETKKKPAKKAIYVTKAKKSSNSDKSFA